LPPASSLRHTLAASMSALSIVLPMAFVMVAGPQIVTAILLATGTRPRRDSVFFLAGAGVATFIGVTASYFLTGLVKRGGAPPGEDARVVRAIDFAIIVLLVFLAWKVARERGRSQPPRWMAKLESATPLFALRIGFLLFLLLPGDLISMFTVGAYLAHHGAPWWHGLVFVALTVALAGVPLLLLLSLGKRAQALLPEARDWMTKNSWIVSEIVIGFFLVMTLKDLLGG
jgi:Sap, sulfolipid-1-addressing protein